MLVSIAIITCNRREFLERAIESALTQTIQDLEIVIVDDGSSDGTREMMEAYQDNRVNYMYMDKIGNIARLRNIAMGECKGVYVAMLDSDDYWHSRKLELQLDAMQKQNATLSFTGFYMVDTQGNVLSTQNYKHIKTEKDWDAFNQLVLNKYAIYPSTFLFKKFDALHNKWFNEKLAVPESDFIVHLMAKQKIVVVNDCLVYITKHNTNSYTSQFKIDPLRDYIETLKQLKQVNRISIWVYIRMTLEMRFLMLKYRYLNWKKGLKN
ncbi:MAG: glycosyltransferase family 2 protein [Candidatus Methylacidiphilales bacterium]